jgi:hypothetical protein
MLEGCADGGSGAQHELGPASAFVPQVCVDEDVWGLGMGVSQSSSTMGSGAVGRGTVLIVTGDRLKATPESIE